MTEPVNVCGTGGWAGPLPGDPDNNVSIAATPAFGGIDVTWTYPGLNPFAVAHTLLYRSTYNSFGGALLRQIVAGNAFYDKLDSNQTYFYWIKIISINGTEGDPVGPAAATAKPLIEEFLTQLSGQIDSGALSQALRADLDQVAVIGQNLATEIMDRQGGETSLSDALADVDAGVAAVHTYIQTEIASRVSANAAFAQDLSVVAATAAGVATAIIEINTIKIGYSALDNGFSSPFDGDGLTVIYPDVTYPTIDYPAYAVNRARIIDARGVTRWNATAAGIVRPCVWLAGMPLATAIKSVGVMGPDGTGATLEAAFQAQKDLNGNFKAQYTAKVDVNGLVGGFGIYNDGTVVEAGFDVDKFSIGRAASKFKPFIIENDEVGVPTVYINKAVVGKLTADMINSNGLQVRNAAGDVILSTFSPLQAQIAPYDSGATRNLFRGTWVTGTVYALGDTIIYLGYGWQCITAHTASSLHIVPTFPTTYNNDWLLQSGFDPGVRTVLSGSGGVVSGDLVWDAQGNRVSGSGVALTSNGLLIDKTTAGSGRMVITEKVIKVIDAYGLVRVQIGDLTA